MACAEEVNITVMFGIAAIGVAIVPVVLLLLALETVLVTDITMLRVLIYYIAPWQ